MSEVTKVRCKMRVMSKQDFASYDPKSPGKSSTVVKLSPVHGPENKSWSQATPSGEISLSITNQDAIDAFKLGDHYYVDFTPAPHVDPT